jgi:uncharacterized membrane protein
MYTVVQVLVMFAFPALVAEVAKRNRMAGMIGPVVLCYGLGLLLGNLPSSPVDVALSQSVAEAVIPVAIALMLFSTRFVSWFRYAGRAVFSFGLQMLAVIIVSLTLPLLFRHLATDRPDLWKISGMLVGVYTGGTPNLAAIGTALGAGNETFIALNACDLLMSATYLLLLMTVAQRLALRFLPSFVPLPETDRDSTFHYLNQQKDLSMQRMALHLAGMVLLAGAIMGLSVGFSLLVADAITAPNVMLGVTTLSIAASFIPYVRNVPKTYELGEYFLLVFCLGIGSISNATVLAQTSPALLAYVAAMMWLSILVHFALSWLFRVDADTMLITSVAGIFGPAFIGPVAAVLKNRDIVVSGLTTGLVGYAVANYLGLAVAHAVRAIYF